MNLDLSKIKNVHFVGIGGIGISAIARMMLEQGKIVTGQDMQEGEIVKELIKIGAKIMIGHSSFENIPNGTDLIVYTVAIETYDPELFEKIKSQSDISVRSYPEMLGIISEDKYTIAVSGTHGKTTTTGMLAQIFKDAGKDPTVVIGSLLKNGTNFVAGSGDVFIVEACEYRRSFLKINPDILVITNIDEDHLDYYKDIEDIKSSFREMAMRVSESGFVVCNPNDKNIADVVKDIKAKVVNYGEYINENLKLKIPGLHNKKNAGAAEAVAKICDISSEKAQEALGEFAGTWRRFEYKGKLKNGTMVYDDYGHAPAEIMATMEGFRELYPKDFGWKITMVFQPHLFSRTKLLLNDFAKSFDYVDSVLILPIYFAREEDDGTISSEILANRINENSKNAKAFAGFESLEKYLLENMKNMGEKDIILTMGAGEAYKVGDFLFSVVV